MSSIESTITDDEAVSAVAEDHDAAHADDDGDGGDQDTPSQHGFSLDDAAVILIPLSGRPGGGWVPRVCRRREITKAL